MSLYEFDEEKYKKTLYNEGREDGKKSIIIGMLDRGIEPVSIADYTGVSYDYINSI